MAKSKPSSSEAMFGVIMVETASGASMTLIIMSESIFASVENESFKLDNQHTLT